MEKKLCLKVKPVVSEIINGSDKVRKESQSKEYLTLKT